VQPIPTIYPAGGEKQLLKVLTGKEVPSDGIPADVGLVCQNVGTAAAVFDAVVNARPLISRIVTVAGAGVKRPCNVEALLGTPVSHLVAHCGGYTADVDRLILGGPMMGFAIGSDEIPIVKGTNCVLAATTEEVQPARPALPCIRCGACAEACPVNLLPQQLYWYARAKDFDKVQDYALFDCIECGCCTAVCPSHIPLVQYYRYAKTEIWAQEQERLKSDVARERHEWRLERLAAEKRAREERLSKKKKALEKGEDKKAAIEAALQRVQKKRSKPPEEAGEAIDESQT
jgi:electron transport complex protein RnfC